MRRCIECTLIKPLDHLGRCETCAEQVPSEEETHFEQEEFYYGLAPAQLKFRHWRCKCGIERSVTPAVHHVTCNRCFQDMQPIGRAELPGVS